jgi:CRP-like cAMP-binding protein
MTFGEMAYTSRGVRRADVRADTPVECRTLPYALLDGYRDTNPALYGKLMANLLEVVLRSVDVLAAEVSRLGG